MTPLPVGLCATCSWVRIATNRGGSVFYRCGRAEGDPTFVRYPSLPVLACRGYERLNPLHESPESQSDAERR